MELGKNHLLLDVETANDTRDALTYDISGLILSPSGENLIEFSFVVRDIFVYERELMKQAYYGDKIPEYVRDIQQEKRHMADFMAVRRYILNLMKTYECNSVIAYNCNFDRNALNTTLRYLTKSKYRWFFPYDTEFYCIWNTACHSICQTSEYKTFAETNYHFSNHGKNYKTSAEVVYQFLTKNSQFQEEHKGLEDVKIEKEILQNCLENGGELLKINRGCWQKVKRGALMVPRYFFG